MDDTTERRHELALFLRARRERTTPEEVGLPGSPRRRTPGLRREELATLVGISTTWNTFLEQGRDVRASNQVLAAIAVALRLDGPEREHLMALGAEAPLPADDREYVDPEVAAVPLLVGENPAYVTGSSYDLLAWNDAASRLFRGATGAARPNLVRWVLLDPVAREVLVDWEAVAQGLLARLRANAGKRPGAPRFRRLEEELRAGSAEADAWWARYDIATSQTGTKRVRDANGTLRLMSYASFQVANQPDQLLTVYRYA